MTKLEYQIQNCDEFLKEWANIKPKQVSSRLQNWEEHTACGTAACAGGWLPHMPWFQRLGVRRTCMGAPSINDSDPTRVAKELFGNSDMFSINHTNRPDHEVVTQRFENQKQVLIQQRESQP